MSLELIQVFPATACGDSIAAGAGDCNYCVENRFIESAFLVFFLSVWPVDGAAGVRLVQGLPYWGRQGDHFFLIDGGQTTVNLDDLT